MLIAFNKPMNVLSQFTDEGKWQGLRHHIDLAGVYAAGRLDRDSEGLLLLTDNGQLQAQITSPKHKVPKTYYVLVEGIPTQEQLTHLRSGVTLKDGKTRPAKVAAIDTPDWLWDRVPPVRIRKTITDTWITITITEGRNRQVRRMCAAVGLPCLRLIRTQIGSHRLEGLAIGEWREVQP